jgi:hypothetical protein
MSRDDITVFIIAIGNQEYKKPALDILLDYFSSQGLEVFVLEHMDTHNTKNAHPSWLKLISHKYTQNNKFTLCWDLDLLPSNKGVVIDIDMLDNTSLNMCYDTSVVLGHHKFNENFFYNGGLIGIPLSFRQHTENIYNTFAPGYYPSYEQYYLNDYIAHNNIKMNILDSKYNTLYHNGDMFSNAHFQHYTWMCNNGTDRDILIKQHYDKYFRT